MDNPPLKSAGPTRLRETMVRRLYRRSGQLADDATGRSWHDLRVRDDVRQDVCRCWRTFQPARAAGVQHLHPRRDIHGGSRTPLTRGADDSVYDYEKAHPPDGAWPPG